MPDETQNSPTRNILTLEDKIAPELSPEILVNRLTRLISLENHPWRRHWEERYKDSLNFSEGEHWATRELADFKSKTDIPPVTADRIARAKTIIHGIRQRTQLKRKIQGREPTDKQKEEMFDGILDYVDYINNIEETSEQVFDDGLTSGVGIYKIGWDRNASQGLGDIFVERVEPDELWFDPRRTVSRDLSNAGWVAQVYLEQPENLINANPDRANEILALVGTHETQISKDTRNTADSTAIDYASTQAPESTARDEREKTVTVKEFYVKNQVKLLKVAQTEDVSGAPLLLPNFRDAFPGETLLPGEQVVNEFIADRWIHYTLVGGKGRDIVWNIEAVEEQPYVLYLTGRKKIGAPYGLVEKLINPQKIIDISYAQVIQWNNKAIKSPIAMQRGAMNPDELVKNTAIGSVLVYEGDKPPRVMAPPSLHVASMTIMQKAEDNFDLVSAATEPVPRGETGDRSSGVKVAHLMANVETSLNPFVKSEKYTQRFLYEKIIKLIQTKYNTYRQFRILNKLIEVNVPKFDEQGNQLSPLNDLSVGQYDIFMSDVQTSLSKQAQEFAVLSEMVKMGIPIPDDEIISRAPISDSRNLIDRVRQAKELMAQQAAQLQQNLAQNLQFVKTKALQEKNNNRQ